MVEFQDVNKLYEGHQALSAVSFRIQKGRIFGLLGPNGAGKTTLLRLLVRILLPDEGNIFFGDEPLSDRHLPLIGYLPEERGLYPKMQAEEHLVFLARLKGFGKKEIKTNIDYWADKLQITEFLKRRVENLSKGQQQKIQLMAALLHNPELLILDEPFSGFDPINAELLKHVILEMKSRGKTLLLSTHRMENAEEICDEIAMLHHGRVVLNGHLNQILHSETQNRYRVRTAVPLRSNELITVLDKTGEESLIETNKMMSSNFLLNELMSQTEVQAFVPARKTLREVFLENVR